MAEKRMKKAISALLSLVISAAFLGSCSVNGQSEKELNLALSASPLTIDPQLVSDVDSAAVVSFFASTLYTYNENNELVPALAESYDVSEDGRIYTFHLKDGLKWSDGRTLCAEDFVYALRRLVDPEVGSGSVYLVTNCCFIKITYLLTYTAPCIISYFG